MFSPLLPVLKEIVLVVLYGWGWRSDNYYKFCKMNVSDDDSFHGPINDPMDDFANDEEIIETRREKAEYEKMIRESGEQICREFSLEAADHSDLGSFVMFTTLEKGEITDSFCSANEDLEVFFIEYYTTITSGRRVHSEPHHYIFGLLTLRKEYPLTYIFKETLKEKIADLFIKADVDIKDQKKFSRAFHMITKDKEKLMDLLFGKPMDDLGNFPDMEVEINGNNCLFRASLEPIEEDETAKFIAVTKLLMKLLA
ncbi:MAG: hypothetical protein ABIR18_04220 [Chitinophagaceae bacterium]